MKKHAKSFAKKVSITLIACLITTCLAGCGESGTGTTETVASSETVALTTENKSEATTSSAQPTTATTERATEPVTEPKTEPATEPATEPVTEPKTESKTEKSTSASFQSTKIPTEDFGSTEKREQVDVEDPNKPIEGGGDVGIEPTSEETTETTEAPPTKDQTYTYVVYGDIKLSMKVNIDDYIDEGSETFNLYRLAKDLGWSGIDEAGNPTPASEKDPDSWICSDGKNRTKLCFDGSSNDGSSGPVSAIVIDFVELDTLDRYYEMFTENMDHQSIHIEIGLEAHADYNYTVAGTNIKATREGLIMLAYSLWFMKTHYGEAIKFCKGFGENYAIAQYNYISVPYHP